MTGPILVMGVSGSGKSTIGAALATALGGTFLDGDDFHPEENVAHMTAGKPLTDAMRLPWLDRLAAAVGTAHAPVVFACSALKRSYRDRLRDHLPGLVVVCPDASPGLIAARLAARKGHFMPAGLLDSQFATLEMPSPDEDALMIGIDRPVALIVTEIAARLQT